MHQLPLNIRLGELTTLEQFVAGANRAVLAALGAMADGRGEPLLFVHAPPGRGKTHLLHGTCRRAVERGRRPAYLPLRTLLQTNVEVLDGLERLDLVCLDDLEAIAGRREWELALFNLCNGLRENGGALLTAAFAPPNQTGIALPDLRSRLSAGVVYGIRPLNDDDKLRALVQRAEAHGLTLPPEVGRYLLAHCPRDLASLFEVLRRLDQASLIEQRRLTLPFVREILQRDQRS